VPLRNRLIVVDGPSVYLRAQPSTSATIVATLPRGAWLEEAPSATTGEVPGWKRVVWNGREGWIAANLLAADTVVLSRVPVSDQGIDVAKPVRPGVYPLKEISTGRQITENGLPVLVDEDGARVR
jgi:hypothetical protein